MDALYWAPLGALHEQLQAGPSAAKAVDKAVEGNWDFLLHGLHSFKRAGSSEESKKALGQPALTLRGRKFGIDRALVPATRKLAVLLVGVAELMHARMH